MKKHSGAHHMSHSRGHKDMHEGAKSMHHSHKSHEKTHHSVHEGREGHGKGFVTGHDEGVGHGDFANLPQGTVMKEYPKSRMGRDGMLDDTITDIDGINTHSEHQRSKYVSYQK